MHQAKYLVVTKTKFGYIARSMSDAIGYAKMLERDGSFLFIEDQDDKSKRYNSDGQAILLDEKYTLEKQDGRRLVH